MTDIADQLRQFREFALARINSSKDRQSLDELFDEWRLQNPDPEQVVKDSQAVAASLADYRKGVEGKPASDVIRKLQTRLPKQ